MLLRDDRSHGERGAGLLLTFSGTKGERHFRPSDLRLGMAMG
jgi:hypothetical protein